MESLQELDKRDMGVQVFEGKTPSTCEALARQNRSEGACDVVRCGHNVENTPPRRPSDASEGEQSSHVKLIQWMAPVFVRAPESALSDDAQAGRERAQVVCDGVEELEAVQHHPEEDGCFEEHVVKSVSALCV